MGSRKNIFITSCIAVFIFFCLVILKIKFSSEKTIEQLKDDSYAFNEMNDVICKQINVNNTFIYEDIKMLTESGDMKSVSKVIESGDKFVIRFKGSQCKTCVDIFNRNIYKFKDLIKYVGAKNVLILLDSNSVKDIKMIKKQTFCDVYGLPVGGLSIELESKDEIIPYYYFILSQKRIVQDCLVPILYLPKRTELYFDSIKRKYAQQNKEDH